MKSVPAFMKEGISFSDAHCVADIDEGRTHNVISRTSRSWEACSSTFEIAPPQTVTGTQDPKVKLQPPH